MLVLAAQTGLRISELTGLTIADIHLGTGAYVHCSAKAARNGHTAAPADRRMLQAWIAERGGTPSDPLFPTSLAGRSAATRSNTASTIHR